jgi:Zn-dependent protease with chaperone function
VFLVALLGNAYLAAMLGVIVALLGAAAVSVVWLKALGLKIAFVIGVLLWVVLKALWIRLDPPEGTEVTAKDAPELFAMIDELRAKLRSPRFHHVLVTDDFNAGVVQDPRLGIFGWYRNYLMIGLPLAKALTPEQFKAVLAHEFGHLAKGHGAMSNWIYRQRLRWARLMDMLEHVESWGIVLFRPFLRWYAPYFNAYSYPLARANEFEADATSARLVSPGAAAQALTAVNVVGSYLQETYWPRIHSLADNLPQPAFAPYSAMGKLAGDMEPDSIHKWLKQALARKTTQEDTHPALTERLGALDEKPKLALPEPGRAADRLLGAALERITQAFDERWKDNILPSWQERHQEAQEGRRRLAELESKTDLSVQEEFERARLTQSSGGDADKALERFRALHARVPDDAVVLYHLGARLLERDDEAGVALLEAAMRHDETEIVRCSEALRDYCWHMGRKEEAHAWHRRLCERSELEAAAAKERDEVRLKDRFERHDLDAEALSRLQGELRSIPGLRKAYFVKKQVKHMPERRCYVLGFTVGGWLHRQSRAAQVLEQIHAGVTWPGETLILHVEGDNYRFGRKFAWMRGSRIV